MNYQKVKLSPGLHFVTTPIGTARDITLRALDVLASAEVLAAEDTRSLRRLMDIHGVPLAGRTVIAYHDHSRAGVQERLMAALGEGRSVAYASEAGTPLIADPGYELARDAAAAGHLVTAAPGVSALTTALTLAGLATDAVFFGGFLPNARAARRARLEQLKQVPGTLVFYESPKRAAATVSDMAEVLGPDRSAAMCREMTKKFEEVLRAPLHDLAEQLADRTLKGEIVLVVDRGGSEKIRESDLETDLREAMRRHSVRDAADLVARMHDAPKRKVYQMALRLGTEEADDE